MSFVDMSCHFGEGDKNTADSRTAKHMDVELKGSIFDKKKVQIHEA